ncbi:MAG: hypothetical protein Q8K58_00855 [Acidimicrobiales bacterium]|nr:hypothetical protein [Acidimicrobiales bacterium]
MAALLGPWPLRILWGLLPLMVGPALGAALDDHSAAVARTGSALAWITWVGVLLAVVAARTPSITAVRVAAPAALVAAAWAAVAGDQEAVDVLAVTAAAATVVAAFSPVSGEHLVNGSSYGDERRMLLRVPAPLLLGPLPLAWASTVGPGVAGALLLAARQWWAGGVVLAVAVPLARVGGRALHGLARRWIVFVPAGLVVHDPQAMVDPVLFPRRSIARLGPAPADDPREVVDLTLGALGLALQLDLVEPLSIAPRHAGHPQDPVSVEHVRVTPTRPGAVLAEAGRRRIAVRASP